MPEQLPIILVREKKKLMQVFYIAIADLNGKIFL
jgi:hypothetical protein